MSRLAFWASLGGSSVSIVEPMLTTAYEREAQREWREGGEAPHGAPWFSSFHASSFPGTEDLVCGRAAVYGLMDIPDPEPRPPKVSAMFDLGLNLEHDWVRRFRAEGVLLSKDVTAGDATQTGFADREHWLTGASDAIVLPPFWRKGHCVEVKTTSIEKVTAMRQDPTNTPFSHSKYLRQILTYIGLAHEQPFAPTVTVCRESWAMMTQMGRLLWCPIHESLDCATETFTLDPPDDGTLIYSSREEPLTTASYYISYDPEHMRSGREKLARWREHFERGEIPPHVHEGQRSKWSVGQCKYCGLKKSTCKPDFEAGAKRLVDSAGIVHAAKVRGTYDYDQTRRAVLDRWGAEDKSNQIQEEVS